VTAQDARTVAQLVAGADACYEEAVERLDRGEPLEGPVQATLRRLALETAALSAVLRGELQQR
jgi:hypothetical protein